MFRDLKSKEQMRIFNVRQVEMMVSEDEENVTNGAVLEGKQLRLKLTSLKMTCFFCVQTMWTKFGVFLNPPFHLQKLLLNRSYYYTYYSITS